MSIGEFARRSGVSARSLRHYEDRGLLCPRRTSAGYREYTEQDLTTVARIRVILDAGLGTEVARAYLDCVDVDPDAGVRVGLCENLRRELRTVEERLDREEGRIRRARAGLAALES